MRHQVRQPYSRDLTDKFVDKGKYVSRHSISENISKLIKNTFNMKLSQHFFKYYIHFCLGFVNIYILN